MEGFGVRKFEIEDDNSPNSSSVISCPNPTNGLLHYSIIKDKILSGEYKINHKRGRSKVWELFGKIEDESGEELPDLVVCRSCLNVFKFANKSTTSLVKHKCFLLSKAQRENDSSLPRIAENDDLKKTASVFVTKWAIQNCRSLDIIADDGLKSFAKFLLSIGAEYGERVNVEEVLPHYGMISANVEKLYSTYMIKTKEEIELIKSVGFGLTSDYWKDSYVRTTYLCLTIHYIKDGQLISKLLGLISMKDDLCIPEEIKLEVRKLLNDFHCKLNRAIIVTNRDTIITNAFTTCNHIFCINHLLDHAIETALKEIDAVCEISAMCTDVVKYLQQQIYVSANLKAAFKRLNYHRWNINYYLFDCIYTYWIDICYLLEEHHQKSMISHLNIKRIADIVKVLQPFEEASKKLENTSDATLHLVYIHIHRLKKLCNIGIMDVDIIKQLKVKLNSSLEKHILSHISVYHKIALFLFPPANKLLQFSANDKSYVKEQCRDMMSYIQEISGRDLNDGGTMKVSSYNANLFNDFVQTANNKQSEDKIQSEISMYENINVAFHDEFNPLQWWHVHKEQFPLLYKLSCRILATPASCVASETVLSLARNLISEKLSLVDSHSDFLHQLLFLHSNINNIESFNEMEFVLGN